MSDRKSPPNKLVGWDSDQDPNIAGRLGAMVVEFEKVLAWQSGLCYEGETLKRQDGGWFLIVRASVPGGERLVCFTGGHSPYACWMNLAHMLKHDLIKWKPDRFA